MIRMMNMFGLFGEKKQKVESPIEGFYLFRANFLYPLGLGGFANFFYDLDINLPWGELKKRATIKKNIEKVSGLIERTYSEKEGFQKICTGEISSDKKEIGTKYYCKGASSPFGYIAQMSFTAVMDRDSIKRAYVFLHTYGIGQEDLLGIHDAIVGLPNLRVSDDAKSTLEQIARIRRGDCPKVENLLLS